MNLPLINTCVTHCGTVVVHFTQVDCDDGSDEDPLACLNHTCPDDMLKCRDGLQCLPRSQFCNKRARGSAQYQCRREDGDARVLLYLY